MSEEIYRSVGSIVGLVLGIVLMRSLGFGGIVSGALYGAGGCVAGAVLAEKLYAWKGRRGG